MMLENVNRRKPDGKLQTGKCAKALKLLAGAAGFEPATCGFGDRRFPNQINGLNPNRRDRYREHGGNKLTKM